MAIYITLADTSSGMVEGGVIAQWEHEGSWECRVFGSGTGVYFGLYKDDVWQNGYGFHSNDVIATDNVTFAHDL